MKSLFYAFLLFISISFIVSCSGDPTPTSSVITVVNKGVNIAYSDTGKGDTTLLFVHGWGINRSYWSAQLNYFSKKFRVVSIDLPGFGQSGKKRKDWSTTAYSQDIDTAIKQLELKNVVLIGHSMAGDIVLQSAIDNPNDVIGIVGIDNFKTVGQPQSPDAKKEFAAALEQLKHNFKAASFAYFNQQLFSPSTSQAVKKRVLYDVAHTDSAIAIAAMEQAGNFYEAGKLRQANLKLYLINSDVHPTDTTGLVKYKIAHHLYIMHGTGHFPMVEDSTEFNVHLQSVLDDLNPIKKVYDVTRIN